MDKRIAYSYIVFLLLLAACEEKPIEWDFDSKELNQVVADGIITNEFKAQHIQLSITNSAMNQGFHPLSGASVRVADKTAIYEFTESATEAGNYYSEPFQVVMGKDYHLTIIYGSTSYEANASVVPVTSLEPVSSAYDTTSNLYHFKYTGTGEPAMTKVYYDWSVSPEYCELYGSCYAQQNYYTLENIDVNDIFGPESELIEFASGTIIIRKKYSLTKAHQHFLRSLLMETEWSGGIFDVQHGNVATNMSNGALGFFAACMVVGDTVVVGGE